MIIKSVWFLCLSACVATLFGCGDNRSYRATTDAMSPTIKIGQKITVDTNSYPSVSDVERWDIVCYEWPDSKKLTCKRVIGLPGETISWSSNGVKINGKALTIPQPFASHLGTLSGPGAESGHVSIPQGKIFVVGDRASGSKDSRYDGPVLFSAVRGKVVGVDGSPPK
jgi:signal peptidase I